MKTVAIFGATGGLGWEFAKLFYNLGWNVCLFGRREQRLVGFRSVYCEKDPSRCFIYKGDITQNECVDKFLWSSIKAFSEIGLVIIGSAIYSAENKIDNEANWRSVMEINFWGTFRVISSIDKAMSNGDARPVVIALSSSLAHHPVSGSGPYSVSKSAMEMFVKAANVGGWCNHAIVEVVIVPPFRSEMNHTCNVAASTIAGLLTKKITRKYFAMHTT